MKKTVFVLMVLAGSALPCKAAEGHYEERSLDGYHPESTFELREGAWGGSIVKLWRVDLDRVKTDDPSVGKRRSTCTFDRAYAISLVELGSNNEEVVVAFACVRPDWGLWTKAPDSLPACVANTGSQAWLFLNIGQYCCGASFAAFRVVPISNLDSGRLVLGAPLPWSTYSQPLQSLGYLGTVHYDFSRLDCVGVGDSVLLFAQGTEEEGLRFVAGFRPNENGEEAIWSHVDLVETPIVEVLVH